MKRCCESSSPDRSDRAEGASFPPPIPNDACTRNAVFRTFKHDCLINFLQEHAESIDAELCAWENEHPDSAMCGEESRLMAIDRATSISRDTIDDLLKWVFQIDSVDGTDSIENPRMRAHLQRECVRKVVEEAIVEASMIATYRRVMVVMATTVDHMRMTSSYDTEDAHTWSMPMRILSNALHGESLRVYGTMATKLAADIMLKTDRCTPQDGLGDMDEYLSLS